MTASELARLLQKKKFFIYGNGYIAKRFFECVKNFGALQNLNGFAVTKTDGKTIGIDGKPVVSVGEIRDRDSLLLLAVHDAVAQEMEVAANQLGFQDVIWIYPNLWQMELGEPVKRNVKISASQLAAAQEFYNVAIDYLAIRHFLAGRSSGLYVKMQCAWSTPQVAEKRMESFKARIRAAVQNDTHAFAPIKITESQELIDGMHRTAMALYFGMQTLEADVYSCAKALYGKDGLYSKGVLLAEDLPKYYTQAEIDEIKDTYWEIRRI